MVTWGVYDASTCVHGDRALTCARCRDTRGNDPLALIVAVLAVAGFLLLGARAVRLEEAAEQDALRQHLERLEQQRPGALERLRDIAAEQRQE